MSDTLVQDVRQNAATMPIAQIVSMSSRVGVGSWNGGSRQGLRCKRRLRFYSKLLIFHSKYRLDARICGDTRSTRLALPHFPFLENGRSANSVEFLTELLYSFSSKVILSEFGRCQARMLPERFNLNLD